MLNKADQLRIIAQLKYFDCNARESEIYLKFLSAGPSSVQDIARELRQNRVTVHHATEQLIDKGLLFETRKGKRRLIAAETPDVLYRLLQKRENEIELTKLNLDHVVNLLSSIQAGDTSIPAVKLYQGVDGFKKMLEETLQNKTGKVCVFTYVDLFSKLLDPDYLEDYFARRAKKNITTRLIFPPCPFVERVNKKAKEYKIEVRLLPPELKWTSGIFSWDDKVSIKSFTQNKLTCTIIENKDIAYFFQHIIFELIWNQTRPI